MRLILMLGALALALGGCAGYTGPSRGVVGSITAPWVDFNGISTTSRADEKPMGYRKENDGAVEEMYGTWTDGQRRATGIPAHLMAEASRFEKLMLLCAVVPNAPPCVALAQ